VIFNKKANQCQLYAANKTSKLLEDPVYWFYNIKPNGFEEQRAFGQSPFEKQKVCTFVRLASQNNWV